MRFLWLLPIALVVGLDQLTKYLAVTHLQKIDTFPLIEGVFHLTYLENRGAAFGMLSDHRWVFMVISTVAVIAIVAFMLASYKKYYHPLLYISLSMIAGGGIGNMIDRLAAGYVVDFLDFCLINFAIFNVADVFVCVGCGMVVLYIILDDIKQAKQKKADGESAVNS